MLILLIGFSLLAGATALYSGDYAPIEKFPYQVSVDGSTSGAIISENWVVTADDEFYPFSVLEASTYIISAGISFIHSPPEGESLGSRHRVRKKSSDEKIASVKIAYMTGFGILTVKSSSWMRQLQYAEMPIMDSDLCNRTPEVDDDKEPAGLPRGYLYGDYGNNTNYRYADYNDSGGSWVVDGRLSGIVVQTPGYLSNLQNSKLYIDITYYRNWINQHINQPL